MQYKVTLPWGNRTVGEIVDDSSREIRRKIQEGGCLEKVAPKPSEYEKKVPDKGSKNKMQQDTSAKDKGE